MSDTFEEPKAQSYIVRIWVEEPDQREAASSWRGHITNVISGERKYIHSVDDITAYFERELESFPTR